MIKITSYNCNSIQNNCEIVKSLLRDTDVLLLQEIMLEKSDLCYDPPQGVCGEP